MREQIYRILFKPDKNAVEYKAVVEAARRSGRAPLDLLQAAGAIDSPYEFHWRRFLFEEFPKGVGFADVALPKVQGELALAPAQAFSIDDSSTTEIDDALSVQGLGSGRVVVGIHIAAPALAFAPATPVAQIARDRLSTVYIPGHKLTMLPEAVVDAFTLAEGRDAEVVSLYVTLDEATLATLQSETRLERVRIAANLRHDVLDAEIDEASLAAGLPASLPFAAELTFLHALARKLKAEREQVRGKPENFTRPDYAFRVDRDGDRPITGDERVEIVPRKRGSPLDLIVAEAMILANSTWGGWLAACGVPAIYRSQASLAPGVKVRMGTQPAPHAGHRRRPVRVGDVAAAPLCRSRQPVADRRLRAPRPHRRPGRAVQAEGRAAARGDRRLRRHVRRVQRVPGADRALLVAALAAAERRPRAGRGSAEGRARSRRRAAARLPRGRQRAARARQRGSRRASARSTC